MSSGDMRSVPYEANFKRVLEAVFWFALGHASCTVLYQLGLSRLRELRLGTTRCPAAAAIRLFMSRWACFWRPRPWQRCSRRRLRAAGSDPMRALRHE
jgi:hypothetical protein